MRKSILISATLFFSIALTACGSSKTTSTTDGQVASSLSNQTLNTTTTQPGINQDSNPSNQNNTQDQNVQVPSQDNEQSDNGPEITLEKFHQVQNGITYDELKKILGGPGQLMSETGSDGDPVHILNYQYKGNSLGSSAVFMFMNGKLQSKFQAGLK